MEIVEGFWSQPSQRLEQGDIFTLLSKCRTCKSMGPSRETVRQKASLSARATIWQIFVDLISSVADRRRPWDIDREDIRWLPALLARTFWQNTTQGSKLRVF